MAPSELDSFYFKFRNLLSAEKNATLTLKSEAGRAQATLSVDLGHVLSGPGPHLAHDARNGTSRSRRRERRAEARLLVAEEADKVDKSTATDIAEEVISVENPVEAEVGDATANLAPRKVIDNVTEKCDMQIGEVVDELCSNKVNEAEGASEIFGCYLCDFKSNWKNGLTIHLTRKHAEIEQLDGNATDNDEPKQDKQYAGSKHYWAEGRLGSAYQTFLDAHAIIEESDLDQDDKENEKAKLLEARKTAFGKLFKHYPPWSLRT